MRRRDPDNNSLPAHAHVVSILRTDSLRMKSPLSSVLLTLSSADVNEMAVEKLFQAGQRPCAIWSEGAKKLSTAEMGPAVADAF